MAIKFKAAPAARWRAVLRGCSLLAAIVPSAVQADGMPLVQVLNGPRPGSLVVRASAPVQLLSTIAIERALPDGRYEVVRQLDVPLRLVARCDEPGRSCIAVGPGELRPIAWNGMSCSAQCEWDCAKNEQLHGRFRFVARSCDRRSRFVGPMFTL